MNAVPTLVGMNEELPAQRGGAKALLLTVLGEFVLPAGGEVWTTSLVAAAETLGIGEKNARQAIARIGEQGLIEPARHGRRVRWTLTRSGRRLLELGTRRIYGFGASSIDWDGVWLVAHCPVAESQRSLRTQLRTRLGFLGFGELSASLLISPHVDRESELRQVLRELRLTGDSVVLRSTTGTDGDDADLVARAWDLAELAEAYAAFGRAHTQVRTDTGEAAFRAVIELVHAWRRFPSIDPELPGRLLPDPWAGSAAADVFRARHAGWSGAAQRWFGDLEADELTAS